MFESTICSTIFIIYLFIILLFSPFILVDCNCQTVLIIYHSGAVLACQLTSQSPGQLGHWFPFLNPVNQLLHNALLVAMCLLNSSLAS